MKLDARLAKFWSDTQKIPKSYGMLVNTFFEVFVKAFKILRGRAETAASLTKDDFSNTLDLFIKVFLTLVAATSFTTEFDLQNTIGFATIGNFANLLLLLFCSLYLITFGILSALCANIIGDESPCTVFLNAYTVIIVFGLVFELLQSLGLIILSFMEWINFSIPILWMGNNFLLILQTVAGLVSATIGIVFILRLYGYFIKSYMISIHKSFWRSVLVALFAGTLNTMLWIIPFFIVGVK